MKIRADFALRQVAGSWVIFPMGYEQADFKGVLLPTDSGVLLWKHLEKGCDMQTLVDALTSEYDVDAEHARVDTEAFIEKLRLCGCLEEE